MRHHKTIAVSGLAASLLALSAHADLSLTGNGLGIYDSGLNAVWSTDANLLGTFEHSQGAASFIDSIIGVSPTVTDGSGMHTISAADFGTHTPDSFSAGDYGLADWWGAQAFVNYLNSVAYAGYGNWALPANDVAGATGGALGELFYNELGGTPGSLNLSNTPFSNLQNYAYWGSEVAGDPSQAGDLTTIYGFPGYAAKTAMYYVLTIAPVPLPGAFLLFGSALAGLGLLRKRQGLADSSKPSAV